MFCYGYLYFICVASGAALNDGLWHSVALISGKGRLSVTVDEDEGFAHARPPFLVVAGSQLFFGGMSNLDENISLTGFRSLMSCLPVLRLPW